MTGATNGTGIAYPSGAPGFTLFAIFLIDRKKSLKIPKE
jgi:hypothetical protein